MAEIDCNTFIMRHLVAKILVFLACAVIMLHTFVPHHHHDFEAGGGVIFDTDFGCQYDGDCRHHGCDRPHNSHHPFDICLIQEMLSHLVISTSDDQVSLGELITAEVNNFLLLHLTAEPFVFAGCLFEALSFWWPPKVGPVPAAPMLGVESLRAPPEVV